MILNNKKEVYQYIKTHHRDDLNIKSHHGTPLISKLILIKYDFTLLKYLVDNNVNLDATDENGWTPLITLAYTFKAQFDGIKLLIDSGANWKAKVNPTKRFNGKEYFFDFLSKPKKLMIKKEYPEIYQYFTKIKTYEK